MINKEKAIFVFKNGVFTYLLTQIVISAVQLSLALFSLTSSFFVDGRKYAYFMIASAIFVKVLGLFILYNIRLRDNKMTGKAFFISLLIATVIHFIVSLISGFTPIIVGDEFVTLGELIAKADTFAEIPKTILLSIYPITVFCIFFSGFFANLIQTKRRKRVRDELVKNKTDQN